MCLTKDAVIAAVLSAPDVAIDAAAAARCGRQRKARRGTGGAVTDTPGSGSPISPYFSTRPVARERDFTVALLVACVLMLTDARPAHAQFTATETNDVSVVFVQPTQTFIVPHVGRSFQNALAFHQKLFDFKPREKITVLLTDFSDAGNASAEAVPRDFVTLRIAPMSFAFETFTASERMSYLMNHELVHVMTNDRPAPRDRLFRQLFRGKVAPVAEHPESVPYLFLTAPRRAAPRWYMEGIAVFLDTWMAGGLGRAQGPFDEMVFRSMVLDGSRFYDPLGLAAELTKTDFQVEANSYLYGARFMNYLAYTHGPESLIRWTSRTTGSKAYYASAFKQVYGMPIEQGWRDWIAFEQTFQQKNIATIREHPTTPYRDVSREALGSLSRAYVDPERRRIYAGLNYPGTVAYVAAIGLDDGRVEHLQDIKQPRIYTVTSLAYDPAARTLFYTADNTAVSRSHRARYDHAAAAHAAQGRAHRRAVVQPQRTDRCGASGRSTASARWCGSRRPTPTGTPCTRGHTAKRCTTSTSRRTASWCRSRSARSTASRRVRVMKAASLHGGRRDGREAVRLRHGHPVELRVLARRAVSVRQLVLHRRVEHLPLRAGDRRGRGADQRRDRILPPGAARQRLAAGVPLHRRRLRAVDHRGTADEGRQRRSRSWVSRSSRSIRS